MYLRQLFSLLIVGVIIYFIVRLATRKKREAKYLNRLEVERLENERKLLEYQDRQRERRELEEERQALAQKGNYFNFIFQQCRLMTNDTEKQTPYYVAEQEISRDEKIIVFSSLVPLSEWYDKKELLEEYLELKIIKIEQEKKNMTDTSLSRTIKLTVTSGELPNMIEWHDDYLNKNANILNIGVGYRGIIGMNLEIYPHTFIAGTSGSGKTNLLKCLIHQSLIKNYDVVLIDFKRGVSFTEFENQVKIYYEYETARNALKELVAETIKRLDAFREHRVDTLRKYNAIPNITKFKRIIIFIDELAELMTVNDKKMASDFYDSIETLTRISRAVGINLIMATQRVDSTIISGQIKSNVIFRVCGGLPDAESSRIMLGNNMACRISPEQQGRVIVKTDNFQEVQCFYYEMDHQTPYYAKNQEWQLNPLNIKLESVNNKIENTETEKAPAVDFDFSDF